MSVQGLRCSECGERAPLERASSLCPKCRRPYFVEYDVANIAAAWKSPYFAKRPAGIWRYRELLPLTAGAEPVSLGETETPLLRTKQLGQRLGLPNLWIKDESRLPGASFK